MDVSRATLKTSIRRFAPGSFGTTVHRVHFLQRDVRLVMYTHGAGFPMEAFQGFYFVRPNGTEKVSMDNIGNHLNVKSELGFMELIAFLTTEKTALYFSPYRYLYTGGETYLLSLGGGPTFGRTPLIASSFFDRMDGRSLPKEERDKYPFQPASYRRLVPYHFSIEMDCLCDEQGRLSRILFDVNNNVLTIREVRKYVESQKWGYCHYL